MAAWGSRLHGCLEFSIACHFCFFQEVAQSIERKPLNPAHQAWQLSRETIQIMSVLSRIVSRDKLQPPLATTAAAGGGETVMNIYKKSCKESLTGWNCLGIVWELFGNCLELVGICWNYFGIG